MFADGLDDLAGLVCLLGSEPALGGVGLDVSLAVNVGGIDTGLGKGGVDGLLDKLFLGLLGSDLELIVDDLLRAPGRGDSDRVHGSDLHGHTLGDILGNYLVETNEGTELAVDLMDILLHERSLHQGIVCEDVLLSGLAGLLLDCLGDGQAVSHLASLESLEIGGAVGDGDIGDRLCKGLEGFVAGDEVGLATEADKDTLATCDAGLDGAFGGLAVSALCGHELALLADDVHSLVEVAFGLHEGLLAIHHAGAGHLA